LVAVESVLVEVESPLEEVESLFEGVELLVLEVESVLVEVESLFEVESDPVESLASGDPSGFAAARGVAGVDVIAAPIPRATAKAPTRPTNDAPLDFGG